MKRRIYIGLALAIALIAACGPPVPATPGAETGLYPSSTSSNDKSPLQTSEVFFTPTPFVTFTNTPFPTCGPALVPGTPTATSPPVPQLETHTWSPEHLLIEFGVVCGVCGDAPSLMSLYVYADGLLIAPAVSERGDIYLRTSQFTRGEVCSLLNTIEQAGFFLYDLETSGHPYGTDVSDVINVNAWETMHVSVGGLHQTLLDDTPNSCGNVYPDPTWLSAISDTFFLLLSLEADFQPVENNAHLLYINYVHDNPEDYHLEESIKWPEDFPSLSGTIDATGCNDLGETPTLVLTSEQYEQIADQLEQFSWSWIFEDGKVYSVSHRPIFPGEVVPACADFYNPGLISVERDFPETLTCTPEDGVLPIPSP